jgi:hypothetical protein
MDAAPERWLSGPLRGMKSGSRCRCRTAVIGFESGRSAASEQAM